MYETTNCTLKKFLLKKIIKKERKKTNAEKMVLLLQKEKTTGNFLVNGKIERIRPSILIACHPI